MVELIALTLDEDGNAKRVPVRIEDDLTVTCEDADVMRRIKVLREFLHQGAGYIPDRHLKLAHDVEVWIPATITKVELQPNTYPPDVVY